MNGKTYFRKLHLLLKKQTNLENTLNYVLLLHFYYVQCILKAIHSLISTVFPNKFVNKKIYFEINSFATSILYRIFYCSPLIFKNKFFVCNQSKKFFYYAKAHPSITDVNNQGP